MSQGQQKPSSCTSDVLTYNVLVSGDAYSGQSAYSALQFCQAAISAGHSIRQVFFYQAAVTQANGFSLPLNDEFNCVESWCNFARDSDCDLVVCVSAAERRGVIGNEQSMEYKNEQQAQFHIQGFNLPRQFSVTGLGALHDACLSSDRFVTFK